LGVLAINSSILTTIFDGAIFSTPANFTTVRIVGLLIPRSIRLMYVRSNPASSPNCSCETSFPFRISRNASPNAFSPDFSLNLLASRFAGTAKPLSLAARSYP
jgi:hypothetical protein